MTDGTDTLSFAYNEAGLRTEKTVGSATRKYIWNESQLLADVGPDDAFYFHYNSGGDMLGYMYKTANAETECILVKNQQGDVERIIGTDGSVLAAYSYDKVVKPEILRQAPPNFKVGKNPNILLTREGEIAYQGARGTGFQNTHLFMKNILLKLGLTTQ